MNPLLIVLIGVAVVVGGILSLACMLLVTDRRSHGGGMLSPQKIPVGERLADGFGDEAKKVGILIAMAAVLGKALMDSGAAERIVLSLAVPLGEGQVGAGVSDQRVCDGGAYLRVIRHFTCSFRWPE